MSVTYSVRGRGHERILSPKLSGVSPIVVAEVVVTYPKGATLEEILSAILDAKTDAINHIRLTRAGLVD